ncbi:SUN2 protein, partial [Atractosteus spatula]|nr:SUN2 protein [Atractosteus spatula]
MEPACRKDKQKQKETPNRGDKAKQKSAQQELKQRQRAEIYALNKVMTELEQQQFEAFCKQMQSQGQPPATSLGFGGLGAGPSWLSRSCHESRSPRSCAPGALESRIACRLQLTGWWPSPQKNTGAIELTGMSRRSQRLRTGSEDEASFGIPTYSQVSYRETPVSSDENPDGHEVVVALECGGSQHKLHNLLCSPGVCCGLSLLSVSSSSAGSLAGSGGAQHPEVLTRLSALEMEVQRLKRERGHEKQGERGLKGTQAPEFAYLGVSETEKWGRIQKEIAQLKEEGERRWTDIKKSFHHVSEEWEADLLAMKTALKSVQSWSNCPALAGLSRLEESLTALQHKFSALHTDHGSQKDRLDLLESLKSQMRSELVEYLVQYRSSPQEGDVPLVLSPELQEELQELEQKILARLAQWEGQEWAWHSVDKILESEDITAVTLQDVHAITERALKVFRADNIGLADYALESAGGSIISTPGTETYEAKVSVFSLFGVTIWLNTQTPRSLIQPDVHPGKCWAFRGSQGSVIIQLIVPIQPTAFTIEHVPKSVSPLGQTDSAPQDFTVYGMNDETEDGTILGIFTYNKHSSPIQTFTISEPVAGTFKLVKLDIFSNWGHPDYTCVYRFRVHGELPIAATAMEGGSYAAIRQQRTETKGDCSALTSFHAAQQLRKSALTSSLHFRPEEQLHRSHLPASPAAAGCRTDGVSDLWELQ